MKSFISPVVVVGLLAGAPAWAGQKEVEVTARTFRVAGRPTIHVRSVDGPITVTAHQRPDVVVRAVKEVYEAEDDAEAKEAAEQLAVEMQQSGDRIELTVEHARSRFIEDRLLRAVGLAPYGVVRFDIRVPASSDLDVRTDDGAISVTGLDGRLQLDTDDGDISVRSSRGVIVARADDGNVRIDDAAGSVQARSDDGDIQLSGELREVRLDADDGDIVLRVLPGSRMDGEWSLSCDDGDIVVTVPGDFAADVEIRIDDGDVAIDLPIAVDRRSTRRLSGRLNGGGRLLLIQSDDGNVRIAH